MRFAAQFATSSESDAQSHRRQWTTAPLFHLNNQFSVGRCGLSTNEELQMTGRRLARCVTRWCRKGGCAFVDRLSVRNCSFLNISACEEVPTLKSQKIFIVCPHWGTPGVWGLTYNTSARTSFCLYHTQIDQGVYPKWGSLSWNQALWSMSLGQPC